MDYFADNEDFGNFLNAVSDVTGEKFLEQWKKHLRENKELFRQTGWATSHLQDDGVGKTAILMGASPAIANQVETLRQVREDPRFILCGLSSNLDFLLKNGIQPHYCITVDADESTGRDWDNIDMDKTKDITLIASTFAYPPMLKRWKGLLYFLALTTSDKDIQRKTKKWYSPINGLGVEFPSIMGQFNVMTAFIFLCLGCQIILFTGSEMSFKDKQARYYVDRNDNRDFDARHPHGDIYGNIVYTTTGLMALKLSLEWFLGLVGKAGWFINCSEAGIFGVTKRFPDHRVPWIKQMTLKNGIAQSRQIMRTGQPLYAS